MSTPEVTLPRSVADSIRDIAMRHSLEQLEARALNSDDRLRLATELASPDWSEFVSELGGAWCTHDHAVVRAIPDLEGSATILVALAMSASFRSYRGTNVVKHFKMSPWTTELSQTLREGHFHTDLSTACDPPAVTVIHCREPDPTKGRGAVHVARLTDLLDALRERGDTLRFLLEQQIEMVDERAEGSWVGAIASANCIRFHPETLRAAKNRGASLGDALEVHLEVIREAALSVSRPIELERGDALVVSNVRALHYRGPCTVRYVQFPRRFEAREIYVLHLSHEPEWPQ